MSKEDKDKIAELKKGLAKKGVLADAKSLSKAYDEADRQRKLVSRLKRKAREQKK